MRKSLTEHIRFYNDAVDLLTKVVTRQKKSILCHQYDMTCMIWIYNSGWRVFSQPRKFISCLNLRYALIHVWRDHKIMGMNIVWIQGKWVPICRRSGEYMCIDWQLAMRVQGFLYTNKMCIIVLRWWKYTTEMRSLDWLWHWGSARAQAQPLAAQS